MGFSKGKKEVFRLISELFMDVQNRCEIGCEYKTLNGWKILREENNIEEISFRIYNSRGKQCFSLYQEDTVLKEGKFIGWLHLLPQFVHFNIKGKAHQLDKLEGSFPEIETMKAINGAIIGKELMLLKTISEKRKKSILDKLWREEYLEQTVGDYFKKIEKNERKFRFVK